MRTLVLTRLVPYPPHGGGAMRVWQTISLLADHGEVSVLSFAPGPREPDGPPRVRHWRHVGVEAPLQSGRRSLNTRIRDSAWLLERDGHRDTDALCTVEGASALRGMLGQEAPDLIVLEELWVYRYLREMGTWRGRIIYDAHNVEGQLRRSLMGEGDDGLSLFKRLERQILVRRTRAIERRLSRQVDAVWACSEADARVVRDLHGPGVSVKVVPNALDHRAYAGGRLQNAPDRSSVVDQPLTILFPAAFGYVPNAVAALLLIREILPCVRASRPSARVLLSGRSPSPEMLAAAVADPGVEVTGEVPDMRPYFARAKLVVVPLAHGSGTRLKILEAFAMGKPVVTTSKGAEGLEVVHGKHLLIAETPEEFAGAILRLVSDPPLVFEITTAAHALLVSNYSWDVARRSVVAALRGLGL